MKRIFTALFCIAASTVSAADLFVQEFGGGGTYPNITDAITAASAGDRILVVPKAGNAPYIENLTINKGLQLLSASNGEMFKLQGSITITTNLPANAHVVINGLWNTTGSVVAGNSTNSISVSIVNSRLDAGRISLGQNINALIANNTLTGNSLTSYTVTFHRGKFLGNTVEATRQGVTVPADVAISATDTVLIVGNKITLTSNNVSNSYPANGIFWDSNRYFHSISNNYVYSAVELVGSGTGSEEICLIQISAFRSGANSNQFNNIVNNTLRFATATSGNNITRTGIRNNAGSPLSNRNNIFNNVVMFGTGPTARTYGLRLQGSPQISYNRVGGTGTFNDFNAPFDGTNTASASTTYTINTNGCVTSHADNGHPDPVFTDLDLTRNDAGACGGSYNISTNFRTAGTAGSAKVHWLEAPRRVLQGGTLDIKAEGHDR